MQLSILNLFCIPHTIRCRCQELQVLDDNRKALIPITIVRNGEVLGEVYKPFALCTDGKVVKNKYNLLYCYLAFIYSIVLCIIGLSIYHKLSTGKAILAVLAPLLIVVLVLISLIIYFILAFRVAF